MKVHVYRVTELFIHDTDKKDSEALQEALDKAKAGELEANEPECTFVGIIPGGQETSK